MGGMIKQLVGGTLFQNVALCHKENPVRYFSCEPHFVGYNHAGHTGGHQALDHVQHLTHHFRIQGGGGLIEQHHIRFHGQRPDNCQTLLLTAGQIAGHFVILVKQAHPVQQVLSHLGGLRLALALEHHGSQGDILGNSQMGEHVKVLEHHAHLLPVDVNIHLCGLGELSLPDHVLFFLGQIAGDLSALEVDLALFRLFQKIQATQEGAFAAAGGTDDGHNLALFNGFVDAFQDLQLAKALVQVHSLDHFHLNLTSCF